MSSKHFRLYSLYPALTPLNGTRLEELQTIIPALEGGQGRSNKTQALYQFLGLLVTLAIASLSGLICGLIISSETIFGRMNDYDYFDDELFFEMPDHEVPQFESRRNYKKSIATLMSTVSATSESNFVEEISHEEKVKFK